MANSDEDLKSETGDEATGDADESKPLTITVQDIGPARKCLTIEVPADRISGKFDDSYKQLQSDANIPGFRKGRAPRRLIERRFSTTVRDDVKGQLISECFAQAVDDHKLEVIGEPDMKELETIELPEDGPLKFQVEVEVAPTVELPPLEGIAVNDQTVPVKEADVDQELEALCQRFGNVTTVEEGQAKESDLLLTEVHILAGKDADDSADQIAHHENEYVRVVGKSQEHLGHVAGIIVDDLGKRVRGKKAGDVLRISMTGPASHEDERIKDQPITIVVRIDRIDRIEPAPAESLMQHLGFDSIERMKEYLKGMLESRASRQQREAMREQVCSYLLEKTELELPQDLTGRQTERLLQRRGLELTSQGVSEDEVAQRVAEARSVSEDEARRNLKLFFILNQAAKHLEIEVTDEEINGIVAQLASEQGRRPERLRQEMQRRGELEHLGLLARERKTLDRVLETAKVTTVEAPDEPDDPPVEPKDPTSKKKRSSKKSAAGSSKKAKTTRKKSKSP